MQNNFQNILILGHRNIGDVLHNMAILKPLRQTFPKARISILTSPTGKTILEGSPYINQIFIFDKFENHNTFFSLFSLAIELRKQKFDLIINLKMGSYFPYFLGSKKIWGIKYHGKKLNTVRTTHAIDIYLNVLNQHGIPTSHDNLDMRVTYCQKDEEKIENLLKHHKHDFKKPIVILYPFAAWHGKEWPIEHFGELAKLLSKDAAQPIFIGGQNDQHKMNAISHFKEYFIDLVGQTNFKELASLYDKAHLAIGCDSGPFHMATNMRVNALGIFGATHHFHSYPYFSPKNVVTCTTHLECNPCMPGPRFMACKVWNKTTPCMEAISLEAVYQKTKELL